VTQLEIDFPSLLGGDQSKTQFGDFDNVPELNKKEVELAKEEWTGQRFRQARVFRVLKQSRIITVIWLANQP
jgi:hypothetical protein